MAIEKIESVRERLNINSGAALDVAEGAYVRIDDSLILKSAEDCGIKVLDDDPHFGWKDLIGDLIPKSLGVGSPTQAAIMGGAIKAWSYVANDILDMTFHLPHDYVPGSDLFVHVHWFHTGTTISGSLVNQFTHTWAKGHNQAVFAAEKVLTQTIDAAAIGTAFDIDNIPALRHRVDEIQLSASLPTAAQQDSQDLEVDGILLVQYKPTTIPTLGGGGKFFVIAIDIHYQSNQMATKNKAPSFYA